MYEIETFSVGMSELLPVDLVTAEKLKQIKFTPVKVEFLLEQYFYSSIKVFDLFKYKPVWSLKHNFRNPVMCSKLGITGNLEIHSFDGRGWDAASFEMVYDSKATVDLFNLLMSVDLKERAKVGRYLRVMVTTKPMEKSIPDIYNHILL
jgi:hypothetical protein